MIQGGGNKMARRLNSRSRKHYGNRTFGAGNTKNRRGKGSRGGVGRAGFHKHKRLHYIVTEGNSTTAPGFINVTRRKIEEIGLNKLVKRIEAGEFKKDGDAYSIDIRKKGKTVKLLGNGDFGFKANITADLFSMSAKEKVEKAGGKIITKQVLEKKPQ